jgi:RsiW-degrading membrane proteinase PrsW (M82 family)
VQFGVTAFSVFGHWRTEGAPVPLVVAVVLVVVVVVVVVLADLVQECQAVFRGRIPEGMVD